MHELALMEDMVQAIQRSVERGRIYAVHLEVGELTAVEPDALRFCFEVCTRGTRIEGAVLDIRQVAASARCLSCGGEFAPGPIRGLCPCGSGEVEVLAGNELRLRGVEVS